MKLEFGNPEHIRLARARPPKDLFKKIKKIITDLSYKMKCYPPDIFELEYIAEQIKREAIKLGKFDDDTITKLFIKRP